MKRLLISLQILLLVFGSWLNGGIITRDVSAAHEGAIFAALGLEYDAGAGEIEVALGIPFDRTVVINVCFRDNAVSASSKQVVAPSGWTSIRNDTVSTGTFSVLKCYLFYRVSPGGTESHTFVFRTSTGGATTVQTAYYQAMMFDGVDTSSVLDAHSGGTASSATSTAPSVTATGTNTMLVTFFNFAQDNQNGYSSASNSLSTACWCQTQDPPVTVHISTFLGYENVPSAGSTGSRFATSADGSAPNIGQMVALNSVSGDLNQSVYRWLGNEDRQTAVDVAPSGGFDQEMRRIIMDEANGHYFLYGHSRDVSSGSRITRVEKRNISDGSLVDGFGDNGVFRGTPGASGETVPKGLFYDAANSHLYVRDTSGGLRIHKIDAGDGSHVTGFGTDGIADLTGGSTCSNFIMQDFDVDLSSGNLFTLTSTGTFPNFGWCVRRFSLSTGAYDSTFGSVTSSPSSNSDRGTTITVDSTNDRLYIGGEDATNGNDNTQFRIEKRLTSNGSLDTGFGSGTGIITSNITSGRDRISQLLLDITANRIYLFLEVGIGTSDSDIRIEKRSMINGTTVSDFGAAGAVTIDKHAIDTFRDAALDLSNSHILLLGNTGAANSSYIQKRAFFDGALVSGFGSSGEVSVSSAVSDLYGTAQGIAVSSGAVIICGFGSFGSDDPNQKILFSKLALSDGSADTSFGDNGTFVLNYSGRLNAMVGSAVDEANGHFYIAGSDSLDGYKRWRLEKRKLSDGTLVTSFGDGGAVRSDFAADFTEIKSITLDVPQGHIYLAGNDGTPGKPYDADARWYIEKRNMSDGSIVSGFGSGGAVTGVSCVTHCRAEEIKLDTATGHIYIAGTEEGALGGSGWRIGKRSTGTGALESGFGSGGVLSIDPSSSDDPFGDIALNSSNGHFYLAGRQGSGTWRIDKRNLSDGSTVNTFGTSGIVTESPGGTVNLNALALDHTGSIFLAGSGGTGPQGGAQWRIEKRSTADGELVSGFGSSGVVTSDPTSINDIAMTIAYGDGQLYIGGNQLGINFWRIEKRDAGTGSLVSEFGTSGVVLPLTSFGGGISGDPNHISLSGSLMIIAGRRSSNSIAHVQIRSRLTGGSANIGSPLADQDTALAASHTTDPVLRLQVAINTQFTLPQSHQVFKLQYAERSGTCDTGFVGETYQDIGTGNVVFHDNTQLVSGETMTDNNTMPVNGGSTMNRQVYLEANSSAFTNSRSVIPADQDGIWDIALTTVSAPAFDTAYCFRLVNSSGSDLPTYTVIPEVEYCENPPTERRLRGGKFFCSERLRSFSWF